MIKLSNNIKSLLASVDFLLKEFNQRMIKDGLSGRMT